MQKNNYKRIRSLIEELLGKKLNNKHNSKIKEKTSKYDEKLSANQALLLASELAEQIQINDMINKDEDMHDFLLNEIKKPGDNSQNTSNALSVNNGSNNTNVDADEYVNISQLLHSHRIGKLVSLFNPKAMYKKIYLSFDSRNCAGTINNTSPFWNFYTGNSPQPGSVVSPKKIRNIISVKLYNLQLYIANNQYLATSTQRFSLFINEFSSQSFRAPSGDNFHFIGLTNLNYTPLLTIALNSIKMKEAFNFGEYHFHTPIKTINSMTLTVGRPLTPMATGTTSYFGNCTIVYSSDAFGNPVLTITTTTPHNLTLNIIYMCLLSGLVTEQSDVDAEWISVMQQNMIACTPTASNTIVSTFYIKPIYLGAYYNSIPVPTPVGRPLNTNITVYTSPVLLCDIEMTYIDSDK